MSTLRERGESSRRQGREAQKAVYKCLDELRKDGISYVHEIPEQDDYIHCDFVAWFERNESPFNVQAKKLPSNTTQIRVETNHIRHWAGGHLPVVLMVPISERRFLWADPLAKVISKGGFRSLGNTVSFDTSRDFHRLNINSKDDRQRFLGDVRILASIWPTLRESAHGRATVHTSSRLGFSDVVDDPRLLTCIGTCSELTTLLLSSPHKRNVILRPYEITRALCSEAFRDTDIDPEQAARKTLAEVGVTRSPETIRQTADWLSLVRSYASPRSVELARSYEELFAILGKSISLPGRHVAMQSRPTLEILRMIPEARVYDSLESILTESTQFSTVVRASYYLRMWGQENHPDIARFCARQRLRLARRYHPNSYQAGIINLQFLYAEALLGNEQSADKLTSLTKDAKNRAYALRFNRTYYGDFVSGEAAYRRNLNTGNSLHAYLRWYGSVVSELARKRKDL